MYQMTPPQPAVPPEPVSESKRLTVPQIMMIIAAVAATAVILVIWAFGSLFQPSKTYDYISSGAIGSRYTGDCLIVRDEVPYDAEGVSSVEYVADEGSTIYRGTTICNVYSSGFSTRELTTLQDYRDQIKEYQQKLLKSQITTDAQLEKLESEVLSRAREVREIISGVRGNMSNQEKLLYTAIQARQQYLKQLYSQDQRMTRLYDDEQSQLQRISSWTKQYACSIDEGVVSFYSDGYEYGLTAENYDQFSPSDVRNMINGVKPQKTIQQKGKTTIYRMVKDKHWYVLMLIRDSNWNPVEGAKYELKLENFKDTTVEATVRSFTRSGGELEVRLEVSTSMMPVLYMRTCTGVLGDSVSSLMVPKRAIYYQDNMPGVVVQDEGYEWFIPVNIIDQKDGMVYIAAIQQGVLKEGQRVKLF